MATISTLRKPDGTIKGFQVNLGRNKATGKTDRPFFGADDYDGARACKRAAESGDVGTGDLYAVKDEALHCLRQLTAVGSSFTEATAFFLKHGARKGNPAFSEVVEALLRDKTQAELRKTYLNDLNVKLGVFGKFIGPTTKIGDITEEQIKEYVFVKNADHAKITKLNQIRALTVLFNYAIKKKLIGINPMDGIDRPKIGKVAPKVLSPEDFSILLNRCLKKKWADRLTVFVLVGFCGVRIEEASQMLWSDIDMEERKVTVRREIAKKHNEHRNLIEPNAMKWLEAVHDARRKGPIIGANWKNLLRSAIRFSRITYTKNGVRHSFASYAIEAGWPLERVVHDMGHNGNPTTLRNHYLNLVNSKLATDWWKIVP